MQRQPTGELKSKDLGLPDSDLKREKATFYKTWDCSKGKTSSTPTEREKKISCKTSNCSKGRHLQLIRPRVSCCLSHSSPRAQTRAFISSKAKKLGSTVELRLCVKGTTLQLPPKS